MASQHGNGWTRRRFLKAAGGAVAGVAGVGIIYEAINAGGSGQAAPSASPRTLALAPSGAPTATPGPTGTAAAGGTVAPFHSRPDLVPPALTVETQPTAVAPGYVFFTPNNGGGSGGPTMLDNSGELVWMQPIPGKYVTDFRVVTYQGRQALAWWEGDVNGGIGSGEHVIADTSYREITRVQAANGRKMDLHEFQLTPQGTALFFADAAVPAPAVAGATPPPWPVLDCAIQEVDVATGKLLWEWHSIDHIAVDETYVQGSQGQVLDYVHTNAISIEDDGTLLVSARNTSAIYKVDRSTGEIVWRLGGRRSDFRFALGATFGWQHDVRRRSDGTLTIFDDESPPVPARGIVLRIDETARTATLVREYRRAQANLVQSQGNVQELANGNVFVGWGSTPFFTEFSRDGTVLYDATFPGAVQSYRDYRFEWIGEPADSPTVAVEQSGDGLTVYASWNGATEVATWEVLGGSDASHLSRLGAATRTGFETAIALAGSQPVVAARALDASGRILGTSATIATTAG